MKKLALAIYVLWFTVSCSAITGKKEVDDADLVKASYEAGDALVKEAAYYTQAHTKKGGLMPSKPILVASLVNVDDMQTSSTFGRIVSEQIGSRVAQNGYRVIEMKLRDSVFIQEHRGELLLSREIIDLSKAHDAHVVIVGTYAASKRVVYVSVKMVSTADNSILSSFDYSVPVGADTRQLLMMKSTGGR